MGFSEALLLALLVIFVVPAVFWRGLRLAQFAPLAVVQIAFGVLLGPGIAGALFPTYFQFIFTPQVMLALQGIAMWAVMIFVFMAGVELDLHDAWQQRRETSLTAALALAFPLVFGVLAAAILWSSSSQWAGKSSNQWQFFLGTGMACAVTALPILVLLLEELSILRKPFGQRVLRYASADDIAIWFVLALILLDAHRVWHQIAFIIGFPFASFAYRQIMTKIAVPDRWLLALVFVLASAFTADAAGLHFMVGAFLAGAATDKAWFDIAKLDQFRSLLLLAFMPVFFLYTGLRTNWDMGGAAVISASLLLLAAAVIGKLTGVWLAAKILGWKRGEAHVVGWLLQTKALIMIIFSSILLDKGIISAEMFTALLLMAVISTLLTVPMVRKKLRTLQAGSD